jgi:uncharacterized damage-inducible protein DinB
MAASDALRAEFGKETRATRRYLERLPDERLEWRPHEKSFTAGGLASHIVQCVRWTSSIFDSDEYDLDPAIFKPYRAASTTELIETFDRDVERGTRLLASLTEDALAAPWRLKVKGAVRFERPKDIVFRDFTLSHLIHHRGQLSVYLRLMNVPVPGAYGPTADE